jgi:hypothetical protein
MSPDARPALGRRPRLHAHGGMIAATPSRILGNRHLVVIARDHHTVSNHVGLYVM